MDILGERIKEHEGFRDKLYLDSEGNLTGGWGHHFYVGSRLPAEACEILFKMDMATAMIDFTKIAPEYRKNLCTARARVVVEMIFNMGLQKVLQFKQMWIAVYDKNFERAADEMLDSKWAEQVGQRAIKLAETMRKGE